MEFWPEYGLFLAKVVTGLVAALVVISAVARAAMSGRPEREGTLKVTRLDQRYRRMADVIRSKALPGKAWKKERKARRKDDKQREKAGADRARVFILDYKGDLRASRTAALAHEITAVLAASKEGDELVVRLTSGGGVVHGYGLAASQLDRVREAGLRLTVTVDLVAASGGYMMACVADRILAAPFAILGSIGVVATIPNVHRLLKRHDVDVELITAGDYKRTLTVVGENTDEDRQRFTEQIEDTHTLFKKFVAAHRPAVVLDDVATGQHWYGTEALELGLVDEVRTSDDYLVERAGEADLLAIEYRDPKSLSGRLGLLADAVASRVFDRVEDRIARHPLH